MSNSFIEIKDVVGGKKVATYTITENTEERHLQRFVIDNDKTNISNGSVLSINSTGLNPKTNVDLSNGVTITSNFSNFTLANLYDNDTGTKAFDTNGNVVDDYLLFEFSDVVWLDNIVINLSTASYDGVFDLEYSDDNVNYTTVLSGITPTASGDNNFQLPNKGFHKYYRLRLTTASSSVHGDFMEISMKKNEVIDIEDAVKLIIKNTSSSSNDSYSCNIIYYDINKEIISLSNTYQLESTSFLDKDGKYIADCMVIENLLCASYISFEVLTITGTFDLYIDKIMF